MGFTGAAGLALCASLVFALVRVEVSTVGEVHEGGAEVADGVGATTGAGASGRRGWTWVCPLSTTGVRAAPAATKGLGSNSSSNAIGSATDVVGGGDDSGGLIEGWDGTSVTEANGGKSAVAWPGAGVSRILPSVCGPAAALAAANVAFSLSLLAR